MRRKKFRRMPPPIRRNTSTTARIGWKKAKIRQISNLFFLIRVRVGRPTAIYYCLLPVTGYRLPTVNEPYFSLFFMLSCTLVPLTASKLIHTNSKNLYQ